MRSRWALLLAFIVLLGFVATGQAAATTNVGRDKPYVPKAQKYTPVPHGTQGRKWHRPARQRNRDGRKGSMPTSWAATVSATPAEAPVTSTSAPQDPKPLATLADGDKSPANSLDGDYQLQLLDESTTKALQWPGLVFEVAASPDSDDSARFVLNYDSLAKVQGMAWASRLQLSTLPACAATTPDKPECRVATPLTDSQNDSASESVTGTLPEIAVAQAPLDADSGDQQTPAPTDVPSNESQQPNSSSNPPAQVAPSGSPESPSAPNTSSRVAPASFTRAKGASTRTATRQRQASKATAAQRSAAASSGGATTLVAVSGGPNGSQGSYLASSLNPTGTWSQGGSAGNFSWSYPIESPPAASGDSVAPDIALSYDSASVDGLNSNSNPQSSWAGLGFDYQPGYIERSYRTCTDQDSSATDKGLCWDGQILTLHMPDGSSTALVVDSSSGVIRPQADHGERVERLLNTGNNNRSLNNEYWRVTTTDGTQYTFGANTLPGAPAGTETHSAWTVPVRGGTECSSTRCQRVWRWNLDMVEDVHQNVAAYYYTNEVNYFNPTGASTRAAYDRAGYVSRIDYGLRRSGNSIYGTTPSERINFTTATRCVVINGPVNCADDSNLVGQNQVNWPDIPIDQACNVTGTCATEWPTYWSSRNLSGITTSYYNGSSYVTVDNYAFTVALSGTSSSPAWDLTQINRQATDAGSTVTLPPVTFNYVAMDSRVRGYKDLPEMMYDRLAMVTSETGATTQITYSGPGATYASAAAPWCTATLTPLTTSLDQNTMECYPVKWVPSYQTKQVLDFFHKYVVVAVDQSDPNALTPGQHTTYRYSGPGWHFDDNEVLKAKARSYGQWRGYRNVETSTGDTSHPSQNGTNDQATSTKTLYYLGMNASGVTNSRGAVLNDADEYAGFVAEQRVLDGTTEISDVRNVPVTLATTAGRPRDPGYDSPSVFLGITPNLLAHVVATQSITSVTDGVGSGAADSTSQATTSYASAGENYVWRPTQVSTTNSGGHGSSKNTCVTSAYADNATTWVRSAVARTSTYDTAICPGSDTTSGLVSRILNYYDASTTTGGSAVTLGDVTRVDTAADISGANARYATTTTHYDAAGRVDSESTYPDGYGTPSTARTTATGYTSTGGALTGVTTTLPAISGLSATTTTQTIDPARGVATRGTDLAGRVTSAAIDGLGRYTSIWKPGKTQGTDSASTTYAYQLSAGSPLAVTTKNLIDVGNSTTPSYVTSIQIFDSRGIARQAQVDTPGGSRAVTDNFVDSHGWTVQTNDRWYTTGTPSTTVVTTADSNVDARTITKYDGVGRPTTVAHWKGGDTQPVDSTSTIYGGDRTTVLPPTGAVASTSFVNALGQQTELDRYTTPVTASTFAGSASNNTTYAYTAAGQVATMTTADGTAKAATWTNTYDLLGRQVQANDPDTGTTTSVYNDAGELIASTDAAAHTTSMSYDAWGRPKARYTGSVATGTQVASWTYDTLAKGSLTATTSTVPSLSGGATTTLTNTVTGYNSMGQPAGTDLTLNVPGLLSKYSTRETYTSTGMPTTKTYGPTLDSSISQGMSAEKLTLWYDRLGNQNGLTGTNTYLSGATYSPYNESSQYVLGVNGATTGLTYTRDPHSRAITNTLLSGQSAPPQIENVATSYDLAGNPLRTVDTKGAAGSPTQTTCYRYDSLRQLTDAWTANDNCASTTPQTSVVGGPQPFWETWTFDPSGSRSTQVVHGLGGASDTTTAYTNGATNHAHALASATTTGSNTSVATGLASPLPSSQSATYNANGATNTSASTAGNTAFSYRPDASLGKITAPNGDKTEYVDDVDGSHLLRIDTTSSATETTLYLPGQQVTLRQVGTTKTLTTRRYYSLETGQQIAVRKNNTNPVFALADPAGTTQMTYDPYTYITTRRAFDPYGNQLATAGAPAAWIDDRTFQNKPLNPVTNLVDTGAREYDPITGRFTSADPILDPSDPAQDNGYNYARNNPATYADPTGERAPCQEYQTCDSTPNPHGGAPTPSHIKPGQGAGSTPYNPNGQSAKPSSGGSTTTPASSGSPKKVYNPSPFAWYPAGASFSQQSLDTQYIHNDDSDTSGLIVMAIIGIDPEHPKMTMVNMAMWLPWGWPTKALRLPGAIRTIESVNAAEHAAAAAKAGDGLLAPGSYAGRSIPGDATRKFTREQRDELNEIMGDTGCHRCGTLSPGTKSGDAIPDHQPPLSQSDGPYELYPHCLACSREQGLFLANLIRRGGMQ